MRGAGGDAGWWAGYRIVTTRWRAGYHIYRMEGEMSHIHPIGWRARCHTYTQAPVGGMRFPEGCL